MVFQDGAFNGLENELLEPPVICDKTIRLSEEEIAILSRGPKFAVRGELIEEDFSIELEKMICKRKYMSIDDSAKTTEFDPAQPLQTGSSFPAKICNEIFHRIL